MTANSSHAKSRFKRDKAVDAAFVSSPDEGRGRFAQLAIPHHLYIAPIRDGGRPSRFPMPLFASFDHRGARAACESGDL
jgi:hypothetical protein